MELTRAGTYALAAPVGELLSEALVDAPAETLAGVRAGPSLTGGAAFEHSEQHESGDGCEAEHQCRLTAREVGRRLHQFVH
jgi:hypothetical protein